jgi:hypothetical protein
MTSRGAWIQGMTVLFSCAAAAALAGCSAGPGSAVPGASASASIATPGGTADGTASARAAASAGPARAVAPLTGLAVPSAVAQRPAVAVAVAGSDPAGLGSADLVFEEITSPVRYLAVFQSNEASTVGPVTSTRPADGQALSVLHPLTSYDGGTTSFISVLDDTKIIDDGYAGHESLYSSGPGGLTVSTGAMAAADRSDGPPPGMFSYRSPGSPLASAQETHPTSVRVDLPGQPQQQWTFDARSDRWVQTAGGPRVSVANLVIQVVPFKNVFLSHRYGETTQSARLIGRGQATVFSGTAPGGQGGTAAAGSWAKPGLAAVTNYLDAADVPLDFTPGPTWIVLAPAGTRISQVRG